MRKFLQFLIFSLVCCASVFGQASSGPGAQSAGGSNVTSGGSGVPVGGIDPTNPTFAGGVKHDGNIYLNGAFSFAAATAGNPVTITCSSCTPAPAAGDVGKGIQATSWDQSSQDTISSTTLGNWCIISSVVPGTSWTCSGANNTVGWSASTGTGVLMVGHDDTAAWQAANVALVGGNTCANMFAPVQGITFVNQALFNTAGTCLTPIFGNPFSFVGYNMGANAGGGSLTFTPTTNFTVASCPGSGSTYFFGFAGAIVNGFAFNGFGINPGGAQTCNGIATGGGQLQNVYLANWQNTSANVAGMNWCGIAGGPFSSIQGGVDAFGGISARVSSASTTCLGLFDWFFQNARTNELVPGAGTQYECHDCAYVHGANSLSNTLIDTSAGTNSILEYNPQYVTFRGGANLGVNINSGTTYVIEGALAPFALNSGGTAGTIPFSVGATGTNVIKLHNLTIQGGSGCCAIAAAISANNKFFIEEGVTLSANPLFQNPPTITLTGFGTATTGTLNGNMNSAEGLSFTITPAGAPAATGTITVALNYGFTQSGAIPNCQMTLSDGTEAWTAPVTVLYQQASSTTSSLAFKWTAGAAPGTTGTLLGSMGCTPR